MLLGPRRAGGMRAGRQRRTVVLYDALGEVGLGLAAPREDPRLAVLPEGALLGGQGASLPDHHGVRRAVFDCAGVYLGGFTRREGGREVSEAEWGGTAQEEWCG
jgi:hypothetical protein